MKGNMPFIKNIISFSMWRKPNNEKEEKQQWTTGSMYNRT